MIDAWGIIYVVTHWPFGFCDPMGWLTSAELRLFLNSTFVDAFQITVAYTQVFVTTFLVFLYLRSHYMVGSHFA